MLIKLRHIKQRLPSLAVFLMKRVKIDFLLIVFVSLALKLPLTIFFPRVAVYLNLEVISLVAILLCMLVTQRSLKVRSDALVIWALCSFLLLQEVALSIRYDYTIRDMALIKHIAYNPLLIPILCVAFYGVYLAGRGMQRQAIHLNTGLTLLIFTAIWYVPIWGGVRVGLFTFDPGTSVWILNNNQLCLALLTVIYCLLWHRGQLSLVIQRYWVIIASLCIIVIALNTSRGALLILFYWFVLLSFGKLASKPLMWKLSGAAAVVIGCISGWVLFGPKLEIFGGNLTVIALNELSGRMSAIDITSLRDGVQFESERSLESDWAISSAGRLAVNFLAFSVFLKFPVLGVGSGMAYNVEVYGSGVHSFIFLLPLASGLVGVAVVAFIFMRVFRMLKVKNVAHPMLLLVAPSLIFTNTLSITLFFAFLGWAGQSDKFGRDASEKVASPMGAV
jgi:hypothetical protein